MFGHTVTSRTTYLQFAVVVSWSSVKFLHWNLIPRIKFQCKARVRAMPLHTHTSQVSVAPGRNMPSVMAHGMQGDITQSFISIALLFDIRLHQLRRDSYKAAGSCDY